MSALLVVQLFAFPIYAEGEETPSLDLDCKSAILIEATTGKVLYEMNADESLPPASVTKVMTLLLIMEAIDGGKISFSDTVTASSHACYEFAACRTNKFILFKSIIEAYYFTAGGANDLVILRILVIVFILVLIVIVIFEIKLFLNLSEIVIKLFYILVKLSVVSLKSADLVSHVFNERKKLGKDSSFLCSSINFIALEEPLDICSLLDNFHCKNLLCFISKVLPVRRALSTFNF